MSEDEKPIFPRPTESSDAEKHELRQQAKLNLEAEEQQFQANNDTIKPKIICANCQTESSAQTKFCRVCGNKLKLPLIPPPTISNNNPPAKPEYNEAEPTAELRLTTPAVSTELEQDYEPAQLVYGPPNFWLKDESDDNIYTTVYGPPPMRLEAELPITIRNLKIEKEVMPLTPPMPAPVYGPPPMSFNGLKKNKILWLVIGLLSGLLIAAVFIIFILVFLRFR